MTRNMIKRVEILFPLYSNDIKQRVMDILLKQIADTVKSRIQDSTGKYQYKVVTSADNSINSQELFLLEAMSTVINEE